MLSPSQLRMARAALRLTVREIGAVAGVAANTVTRIEGGAPANRATLAALRRALEERGCEFSDDGETVRHRLTLPDNSTAQPSGDADD